VETLQHLAGVYIAGDPSQPCNVVDIAEIDAVAQPQLRLAATADRDRQVTPILRGRMALPGEALGEIGADRFRRRAELIRQGKLFDPRQCQAGSMDLQRQPIGASKHLEVFDPLNLLSHPRTFLAPDSWFLTPETRSFGAWLEPRYIFGAGQLDRPVSYYAFFKGWLLLSQPPGCLGRPTSFTT